MHEYAVTKGLIDTSIDEASKIGAKKIVEIRIVIGDLSTIIDDSVQMYFDIMSEGTMAEGCKLIFKRVKAQFKCRQCEIMFEKPKHGFDCPNCGSLGYPTDIGREFYIESIEVE